MLSPSRGLGGGIERYAETLEWAFQSEEVSVKRLDLYSNLVARKAMAHARLYASCRTELKKGADSVRIIVLHRSLLPVAWLLANAQRSISGISLICHGNEIWGGRPFYRKSIEDQMIRRSAVRLVAVSSYTAGALSREGTAAVLPPGLSDDWFKTLVSASKLNGPIDSRVQLVTAFRLAQWCEKGLPQLIEAISALKRHDVLLTVCGTGTPPPGLLRLIERHTWCTLFTDLPSGKLAQKYAQADLMVLATQARSGSDAFCESYGLVLIEAQVAGTPVVAPAFGGSRDTFVAQRTGVSPASQAPEDLSRVLADLTQDRVKLAQMGADASAWARDAFSPEKYARRAVTALL